MKALLLTLTLVPAMQAQSPVQPPVDAAVVATVQGRGVQIYRCDSRGGAFAWSFQAPEAELFDLSTGKLVGKHGAGPSWTWNDGGSITGKVLAKSPSPDAESVPWLLLQAMPANAQPSLLSDVAYVQRTETHGGNAPASGCDASHSGASMRVPYIATYTFYKKTK